MKELRMIAIGNEKENTKTEYNDFGVLETPVIEEKTKISPEKSIADEILGGNNIYNVMNSIKKSGIVIVMGEEER